MLTEPKIEQRAERPYVAIPVRVTMKSIATDAPPLIGEVFGWLQAHGIPPAGPPFFRYLIVDMEKGLELEVGVPVASVVAGDGRVHSGAFPSGRYATVVHTGPYKGLRKATATLLNWAETHGITWSTEQTEKGDLWRGRFEFYPTDPTQEPDPKKWEAEIAFLVADD